jgi:hypothetical protein
MDFLISGYDQIGGFARTKDGKGAWYDGSFFIDGVPSLKLYKRRIMRNGEY